MNNFKSLLVFPAVIVVAVIFAFIYKSRLENKIIPALNSIYSKPQPTPVNSYPLSIRAMRARNYPGNDITLEQTLPDGANYKQYIVSYLSDGLKIYALLTVPNGNPPAGGFPVIIFNHGYIPPDQYRTTERYVAYVAAFARSGYIVFKSDYRGNGNSAGQPEGAYYSPAYATDVLNAVSAIKKFKNVNPDKIGMWGHSMGGNITLRDIVIDPKDIKAAVIWGGVVGSYDDLMNNWQRRVSYQPSQRELALRNNYRKKITDTYGTPESNPQFWNVVDPTYFLSDISTPIQLHTGGSDEEVPVDFSQGLYKKLQDLGKTVEYYNYPGADHNISGASFDIAMERSIKFFDSYIK